MNEYTKKNKKHKGRKTNKKKKKQIFKLWKKKRIILEKMLTVKN